MAQLASCPHCESEFVLPEPTLPPTDTSGQWGQCPSCNRSFELADVTIRPLPEALIVPAPNVTDFGSTDFGARDNAAAKGDAEVAKEPETDTSGDDEKVATVDELASDSGIPGIDESPSVGDVAIPLAGAFGGSTLASFLRDGKESKATDATNEDTETDSSTLENESEESEEPSPALDRMGATFGSVFDFGKEASKDSDASDSLDEVSDAAKENELEPKLSGLDSFKSTLPDPEELVEKSLAPEQPSFDFEVGGESHGDAESSAPTFDFDAPLALSETTDDATSDLSLGSEETRFEENDEEGNSYDATQVNIDSEESTGHVAIRRRASGGKSMLRQLVGVVFGGVMGLGLGYWLLLWILHWTGRTDDPLSIAKFYPNAIKPSTFQSGSDHQATSDATTGADSATPNNETLASNRSERNKPSREGTSPKGSSGDVDLATFEQPVEPAAPTENELSRTGVESVHVSGVTPYSAAQVMELTKIGPKATKGLLGGRLSDASKRSAKGRSYAKLADLAHAIALAEDDAGATWKQDAIDVFRPLFKLDRHREEIATIASVWWKSNKRSHGGIFFSGVLGNGVQRGSVMEYNVVLPTGQELRVLTREPLPESLRSARSVGLIGVGLEDPATRLEGYSGNPEMAVWANDFFPID